MEEIQGGELRAEYGKNVIPDLSEKLNRKYGKGFSETSLQYFRKFYLAYENRIPRPVGVEFKNTDESKEISRPRGAELNSPSISRPLGDLLERAFSPQLNWSHYRVLMRIKNSDAREFYEKEAVEGGWDKRVLERHIHSQYYERLLQSQQPEAMSAMCPIDFDDFCKVFIFNVTTV